MSGTCFEDTLNTSDFKNVCSNVNGSMLLDIYSYARYEPQVLQVELHPYLTQEPLIKLAKDCLGMGMTGFSSFGPASWVEIGGDMGAECLFKHDTITKIADAHSRSMSDG